MKKLIATENFYGTQKVHMMDGRAKRYVYTLCGNKAEGWRFADKSAALTCGRCRNILANMGLL